VRGGKVCFVTPPSIPNPPECRWFNSGIEQSPGALRGFPRAEVSPCRSVGQDTASAGCRPKGAASLSLSFGSLRAALVLGCRDDPALESKLNQLAIASLRSIVDGEGLK
jgi:hypothetical protein